MIKVPLYLCTYMVWIFCTQLKKVLQVYAQNLSHINNRIYQLGTAPDEHLHIISIDCCSLAMSVN
jgi:hypothetical protein